MAKTENGAADGAEKTPKKRTNPEGRPFTPMTAKQAQEASVRARNIRKQVRAQLLEHLVNNYEFGPEMIKALKKGDLDKVELIQKAMRLVGLTHDQSEEAVQNIKVDSKSDANVTQTVRFTIAPRPANNTESKE